ncbi:MAG TPA: stage II sporulation protein SpoIID, partial [candidate division WOR-3 bacterium]|nr:stage II sporulation protein SpoIID [candidate division WOR-3 bacterium]
KFRGSDGNVFVLRGGGFGHGVGMCQMGAGMMAYRGKDYREILRHYFTDVDIAKIY